MKKTPFGGNDTSLKINNRKKVSHCNSMIIDIPSSSRGPVIKMNRKDAKGKHYQRLLHGRAEGYHWK